MIIIILKGGRGKMAFTHVKFNVLLLLLDIRQRIFNDTKVTILGLNPVTTYRFQVFADNGVSEQVPPNEHQFIDIAVTTEASVPSSVSNVRIINVRSTELTLRWDPPDDPYSDIEMYEVRYFMKGYENNVTNMLINRPESAFTSLRQQTVYGFQVRAKTTHGWGDFSAPVYKTTGTVLGNSAIPYPVIPNLIISTFFFFFFPFFLFEIPCGISFSAPSPLGWASCRSLKNCATVDYSNIFVFALLRFMFSRLRAHGRESSSAHYRRSGRRRRHSGGHYRRRYRSILTEVSDNRIH